MKKGEIAEVWGRGTWGGGKDQVQGGGHGED